MTHTQVLFVGSWPDWLRGSSFIVFVHTYNEYMRKGERVAGESLLLPCDASDGDEDATIAAPQRLRWRLLTGPYGWPALAGR